MINELVHGKQSPLVWYVDDKKVSHTEAKAVKYLITKLKKHFGELVVTIVENHTFFNMNINIIEDKDV